MTVGAKQVTLRRLLTKTIHRVRHALRRYPELLLRRITMMEVQGINAAIVTAPDTTSAVLCYEHPLDMPTTLCNPLALTRAATPSPIRTSEVNDFSMLLANTELLLHRVLHHDVLRFVAHGAGVEPALYLGNSQAHSPRLLAVNVARRRSARSCFTNRGRHAPPTRYTTGRWRCTGRDAISLPTNV